VSLTTLALTAQLPELGESLTWSQLEAWAVAMREELPAAALAAALEELQDRSSTGCAVRNGCRCGICRRRSAARGAG
jgi:hypothetical protein